jgi:hypothetical protein
MRYGGNLITPHPHNTDTPGKGPETIDPRNLPAAPDAYREEPQIFFMAPKLPPYDVKSDKFRIGKYYMGEGYLRRLPNGRLAVLYYVALNQTPTEIGRDPPPTLHRREWVIGPDSLKTFAEHEVQMLNIAWAAYPREGEPSAYVMHSARYVSGVMHGDPDRAHEGWDAWKSAFKDPGWWSEVIFNYLSAHVPEPEVAPKPAPGSTPTENFGPPRLVPTPKPDVAPPPIPKPSVSTLPNPKPSVSTSAPYVPRGGGAAAAPKLDPLPEIPALPEVAPPLPAKPPLKSIPLQDPVPTPIGPAAPLSPRGNPPPAWIVGTLNSILTGINVLPGVAPQPQQNPQQRARRPVTLVLPPQKAALASLYRGHLGRLQHRIGRNRHTDQQAQWDADMDPRSGGDMTLENFCRGRSMEAHRPLPYTGNLSVRDVLRPRWSPTRFWPDMQVDHRIEMQVAPIGGEAAYDQNWNYELLDRSSNTSSGPRMRANIRRERSQLAAHYGDQTWMTRDLTFERIDVEPASPSGRWSYAQVRDAEHLDAYQTLTGEPEPDPAVVGECRVRGG